MAASLYAGAQNASIRNVKVLGSSGPVEIEIESSARVMPQALVLTGPDRLVLDFPNATPGQGLHSRGVDRGDVKSVRVGLFSSNPPTTRVVVDLQGPVAYQLFPQGKSIILKLGDSSVAQNAPSVPDPAKLDPSKPGVVNVNYAVGSAPVPAPPAKPAPNPLDVSFRNGLLTIKANRVSLSQVLFAVQQSTGAEIAIPAGAEQEKVAVNDGPAPAAEVLAHLLNGSRFNFLILNSATDPRKLDKVVLTLRPEGSYTPGPASTPDDDDQVATIPPPSPLRGNEDAAVAVAQDNPPEDVPPAANTTPSSNTFPNARPTVVKAPGQEDAPDY
jgi:AMIN domain